MVSRRSDLEALQALSCVEELARADSPVSLIGTSLGLPEPGDGPEAWAGFLIRWAQAIHPGCLDALAEERRLVEEVDRALLLASNFVPASRAEAESLLPIAGAVARAELEEVPPQPFQDAVAEAGGYRASNDPGARALAAGLRLIDGALGRPEGT